MKNLKIFNAYFYEAMKIESPSAYIRMQLKHS